MIICGCIREDLEELDWNIKKSDFGKTGSNVIYKLSTNTLNALDTRQNFSDSECSPVFRGFTVLCHNMKIEREQKVRYYLSITTRSNDVYINT